VHECRDVARVVLEVAVHGDDDGGPGVVKAGSKRGSLAEVAPQLDERGTFVAPDRFQHGSGRAVGAPVVHEDDLVVERRLGHRRRDVPPARRRVLRLVVQGHNDGDPETIEPCAGCFGAHIITGRT